jgi:hypothetical protein
MNDIIIGTKLSYGESVESEFIVDSAVITTVKFRVCESVNNAKNEQICLFLSIFYCYCTIISWPGEMAEKTACETQ